MKKTLTIILMLVSFFAFSQNPSNQSVCAGSTAQFDYVNSGGGTPDVWWYFNGTTWKDVYINQNLDPAVEGKAAYFKIFNCQSNMNGWKVVPFQGTIRIGDTATLTVNSGAAIIISQPTSKFLCSNGTSSFNVSVNGIVAYLWQSTNDTNGIWMNAGTGFAQPTFTFNTSTARKYFRCRITGGCPSTVSYTNIVTWTVNSVPVTNITKYDTICYGVVKAAKRDTLRTVNGCDSIITVTNYVNRAKDSTYITLNVCHGASHTTKVTLTNKYGCDSIVFTNTIATPIRQTVNVSVCKGTVGTDIDTLTTADGCDSIVTVITTLKPKYTTNNPQAVCDGYSYSINNHTYNLSGTYYDTLVSSVGCDSIIVTQLTVNPKYNVTIDTTINEGSSFTVGVHTYTVTGTYKDTLPSIHGCDSIITTNLTVKDTGTVGINETKVEKLSLVNPQIGSIKAQLKEKCKVNIVRIDGALSNTFESEHIDYTCEPGIYVVTALGASGKVFRAKVVVQ